MNLLLVNKYHYLKGGAERYYLDLGERFAARGDAVSYLAMDHPDNVSAGSADHFVSGVDYRAKMSGVSKARHALRSIYNTEVTAAVHRLTRQRRPQVAHLHNIYHQLTPSVIRALDSESIPIVQTLHDYKLVCPAYLLLTEGEICERCKGGRYYEAFRHRCLLESRGASLVGTIEAYFHRWMKTYEKVRYFLCPSHFMLEKVRSFGIEESRLIHLPYFLPAERYKPIERTAAYYVYAGRLSREKGVATLLEAHGKLPAPRPPLRILGDGPLRATLEARAGQLGLTDISFEGYQPPARLREIVGGALFVVVPSEWFENYPFAILEAFALARPVLGARIGGIPELVRDSETGFCAEPANSDSLAAGIAKLAADPEKADSMGKVARRWMERELAPGPHLEKLDAIYQGLTA